jgi:Cdc6-like AAA superfamily ATPase
MEKPPEYPEKKLSWQLSKGVKIGSSIKEVYENINLGRDAITGGALIPESVSEMIASQPAPAKRKGGKRKTKAVQESSQTILVGKSVFVENIETCKEDDIQALVVCIEAGGIQQVVLKIADGTKAAPGKVLRPLSKKLMAAGARVWGWQRLSSETGAAQASVAADLINKLSLSGYIAQVGSEFKDDNSARHIRSLFKYLGAHAPGIPLGVMSYHYPSYHRDLPWDVILQSVDFVAPQVFWENAHNPGAQLSRSLLEYRKLSSSCLVIPVGAAYQTRDWQPTEGDLLEFIQTAQNLGLGGVGFYNWDWLGQPKNRTLLNAITAGAWGDHAEALAESLGGRELVEVPREPEDDVTASLYSEIPPAQFERRFIQVIRNDEVRGVEDKLGFDAYADAFVQLVMDERTRPPLTIGVSGAWGSGKSFLLENIHREIEKRAASRTGKRRVKNRNKAVHVVRFNAWDYNAYDAIWPGLVRQLIDALEKNLHPRALTWMRLKRNLKRQVQAVRNKLIPWTGIAIAIIVVLLIAAGGMWENVLASLSAIGLAGLLANFIKIANEPVAGWMTRLFSDERGYGAVLDYMSEIRADIDALKNNLPDGQKIVIFIDDLDRCTSGKITGALEAIKLLLTYDIFFVFLAVDTSVVARAVEKEYKDVLAEAGRSGYLYLDKIIQIPFRIPEPAGGKVLNYLNSLLKAVDMIPRGTLPPSEAKILLPGLRLDAPVRAAECEVFLSGLPNDPTEILRTIGDIAHQVNLPSGKFWIAAIWGLLARWWPASTYLMHESLRNLPAGQEDDNALPLLFEAMRQQSEASIQSRRLREQVDAAPDMLHKAIQSAPQIRVSEIREVLSQWQLPYMLTLGFDPKETEAFYLLSKYLYKNPRHIKRLVNTFSLIRMLVSHSRELEDALVLHAPETMLKWLILTSQWPLTAQVMLHEFDNEIQVDPGRPLPEDDDALTRLYEKALLRIVVAEDLRKERSRLDYDPDVLESLVRDGMTILTSRQLNLLRAFAINFNPAENSQSIVMARTSQPTPAA